MASKQGRKENHEVDHVSGPLKKTILRARSLITRTGRKLWRQYQDSGTLKRTIPQTRSITTRIGRKHWQPYQVSGTSRRDPSQCPHAVSRSTVGGNGSKKRTSGRALRHDRTQRLSHRR